MVKKARDHKVTDTSTRPNVFAALFDSDLPPQEKTIPRLTFHLLSKPTILDKLTRELQGAVTNPKHLLNWPTLETLPYLNAVISEGLRLAPGESMRTGRVATEEDLVYRGKWRHEGSDVDVDVCHVIPSGWAVSMSAIISHLDKKMFPNAKSSYLSDGSTRMAREEGSWKLGSSPFPKALDNVWGCHSPTPSYTSP
ncbi:trichodiene oxygenase [Colletotrichum salicis]|uniref:Trichodiene oxygenase n=1 Tax=Colletotrichum salicis TaxID=1209931 RepID=A0A135SI58_9PEZI|nr:trichodiene oxygenase [Colletotrichum salicis]